MSVPPALVRALLLALPALALAGCPIGDCPDGSEVAWADVQPIFEAHCLTCHSSDLSGADRQEAPAQYNYDTYAAASAYPGWTWTEVNIDAMPPSGGVSDADKETIRAWLACDAPE